MSAGDLLVWAASRRHCNNKRMKAPSKLLVEAAIALGEGVASVSCR